MRGLERNKRNGEYLERLRETPRNWEVSEEDERGIQELGSARGGCGNNLEIPRAEERGIEEYQKRIREKSKN